MTSKEFYVPGEKDYLAKITKYETAAAAVCNQNKVLSENFRNLERNDAWFARHNYLNNYQEYHGYVSGDKE